MQISPVDYLFTPEQDQIIDNIRILFSSNQYRIDDLFRILYGNSPITICTIDWFVSIFSKHDIELQNDHDQFFNVHNEYKKQLDHFRKIYFDPFRREYKVICSYENKNNEIIKFTSSIGQLNFFCWAIQNKVIDYINTHIDEINFYRDLSINNKKN